MTSDSELEVGGAEFFNHVPDLLLYGHHLLFNEEDLTFLLCVFVFHFLDLVREVESGGRLLSLAHLAELLMAFYFSANVFVILFDQVDLGV